MWRSDPQMFADVTRTKTSVARSIRASGTSLTLTFRGPSYTTAFMLAPLHQCVPKPTAPAGLPITQGHGSEPVSGEIPTRGQLEPERLNSPRWGTGRGLQSAEG